MNVIVLARDVLEKHTDDVELAKGVMELQYEIIRLTREIVGSSIPGSERQRINQEILDKLEQE